MSEILFSVKKILYSLSKMDELSSHRILVTMHEKNFKSLIKFRIYLNWIEDKKLIIFEIFALSSIYSILFEMIMQIQLVVKHKQGWFHCLHSTLMNISLHISPFYFLHQFTLIHLDVKCHLLMHFIRPCCNVTLHQMTSHFTSCSIKSIFAQKDAKKCLFKYTWF